MVRKMTMKPETMECEACARCVDCDKRIGNNNGDWLWVDRNLNSLAMLTGTNPQPSCDRPPRWTKFCVWCHVTRLELRLPISETQKQLMELEQLKVDNLKRELMDLQQLQTEQLQQELMDIKQSQAEKLQPAIICKT